MLSDATRRLEGEISAPQSPGVPCGQGVWSCPALVSPGQTPTLHSGCLSAGVASPGPASQSQADRSGPAGDLLGAAPRNWDGSDRLGAGCEPNPGLVMLKPVIPSPAHLASNHWPGLRLGWGPLLMLLEGRLGQVPLTVCAGPGGAEEPGTYIPVGVFERLPGNSEVPGESLGAGPSHSLLQGRWPQGTPGCFPSSVGSKPSPGGFPHWMWCGCGAGRG